MTSWNRSWSAGPGRRGWSATDIAPPAGVDAGQDAPAAELTDAVMRLSDLTLAFSQVPRGTFHPDGVTRETDTTHTVMLGLVACSLAHRIGGLDVGRVAQSALGHDLPEVHAGDTLTLKLPTAEQAADKKRREAESFAQLSADFGEVFPWLIETIEGYETKRTAEDDFVWIVDKILPKTLHIRNGGASPIAQGIGSAELAARYARQREDITVRAAGRWPLLLAIYDRLVTREVEILHLHEQTKNTFPDMNGTRQCLL